MPASVAITARWPVPVDAIAIVQSYYAEETRILGHQTTPAPAVPPLKPKDKDGNPDQWNVIERLFSNAASVRNFKPDPVPDHLIRRVLEAGRFAPSAGNCQSWKFHCFITDRKLLDEIDHGRPGSYRPNQRHVSG